MSFQPVHFYQTGTFTVGNRLLGEEERSVQADIAVPIRSTPGTAPARAVVKHSARATPSMRR
jgi:hypothetical protein